MKLTLFFALLLALIAACQGPKKITSETSDSPVEALKPEKIKIVYKHDTIVKEKDFYTKITKNYNYRKPNFVIIHHTAQDSCEQTYYTFSLERTQVSSHYVICKDGTVTQLVDDMLRAWHAGNSRWGSNTDLNSSSIGIELDNNGYTVFAQPQLDSLEALLARLKKAYGIPAQNFIGHGDIAPGRKNDPNVNFPWQYFASKGYGMWYDADSLVTPPINFNDTLALRIIGYDVRNVDNAKSAFNRHFMKLNNDKVISPEGMQVLYNLFKKYLQY
jgi:N-acetylmuramoyl-L-alanine amidase